MLLFVVGCLLLIVRFLLLVVCCCLLWAVFFCSQSFVVLCFMFVVGGFLVICSLLSIGVCVCLQFVACCSVLVAPCLSFTGAFVVCRYVFGCLLDVVWCALRAVWCLLVLADCCLARAVCCALTVTVARRSGFLVCSLLRVGRCSLLVLRCLLGCMLL